MRAIISLISSHFPSTKHLINRAALGGRRPIPRTTAALHELLQGVIEPGALLEELLQPWRKTCATNRADVRNAKQPQLFGAQNVEDVGHERVQLPADEEPSGSRQIAHPPSFARVELGIVEP